MTVRIEAPPEKLALLKELQELDRLEQAERARLEYPTPGALAKALDPMIVQTPALELVDAELVAIRDAISVMFRRRARFVELVDQGVALEVAIEACEIEIPDEGNNRLILSMAPQEGKSTRATRNQILWLLRQFPTLRAGIVSYDGAVASTFSYQIRSDIELFDGQSENLDLGLRLAKDQKAMSRWTLTTGGGVYAVGIGGGLAGRPLDLLVIDDPVKDERAAESLLLSSQAWEWWHTVARPRLAPWAPVMEVSTRWHDADLAGRLKMQEAEEEAAGSEHYDRWRELNIPAQADHDPDKGERDVLDRAPGEFMVSARGRTRAQWEATKNATPARFWSALFQGKPTPDVGDIWLKEWWRRYDTVLWSQAEDGTYRLPGYDLWQSWDMAFRDTKASDYVVGQVWAKRGADSFLIYQVWRRLSFTATLEAVRRVTRLFPMAQRKIVEAKANGDAVIDSLQHEIPGFIPAEPTQSKEARAIAVSPVVRSGNVYLPSTQAMTAQGLASAGELSFDVEAFILQATAFPNGANDDAVDACSQYLAEAYLIGGEATFSRPIGALTRTTAPRPRGATLSPIQKRLAERSMARDGGQ